VNGLRILMVIHTPWTRDLGAPRVQLELAEELRALGHRVEKFSYEDAFPRPASRNGHRPGRLGQALAVLRANRSFAARAGAYVAAHARRFDVVEAHQTDLPLPKRRLGLGGLLVARSVGLIPVYREFERFAARRWPEPASARDLAHRALTWPGARRRNRDVLPSFRSADLINVSNRDDLRVVAEEMGFGDKAVMFPFGLSRSRAEAFARERATIAERLAAQTVAFIGTWNSRKGAKDWPEIVARVRRRVPGARFLFLGTGMSEEAVRRGFPAAEQESLAVVPAYRSEELPELLARATVGAFPGYLEGFGFGLLEKLAAGLPTVAYDAPGPREMLRRQGLRTGVPAGDVAAFADRLADLLTLAPDRYAAHAADSRRVAACFSWGEIAERTAECYRAAWERLR
jgi:glycosyltransferase involved in cell wall biosynthesis